MGNIDVELPGNQLVAAPDAPSDVGIPGTSALHDMKGIGDDSHYLRNAYGHRYIDEDGTLMCGQSVVPMAVMPMTDVHPVHQLNQPNIIHQWLILLINELTTSCTARAK